jgi:L-alanine-DL-glutamate epimerase-like enolase superfamily enzyme
MATGNGLLGLGALVNVCATLPVNYVAFEYPSGTDPWWYEIVEGLPEPIVKNGLIDVFERPGLGVDLIPEEAKKCLKPEDADFFD